MVLWVFLVLNVKTNSFWIVFEAEFFGEISSDRFPIKKLNNIDHNGLNLHGILVMTMNEMFYLVLQPNILHSHGDENKFLSAVCVR